MEIEKGKKHFNGKNGFKELSIKLPLDLYERLDEVAEEADISKNDLVNALLEDGIRSVMIKE